MDSEGLRSRPQGARVKEEGEHDDTKGPSTTPKGQHATGKVKHSVAKQYLLMFAFGTYFVLSCIGIHIAQYMGLPVYLVNRDWYYAWVAMTKQYFGLIVNNITQWFAPTVLRISADESVRAELRLTDDGLLKSDFPERMVLMANHQIYTDWIYLWWTAYTAGQHGHVYIILKDSLKYIPFLGPGMLFYGFIFLARNWVKDKPRFERSLSKLNSRHGGPLSGTQSLDPMWLIIFPEGTNISVNGRNASKKWAEKSGLKDMQHQLLPRSTGLHFTLDTLQNTVDWVYDCTIAYEGVPRGQYGQDIFTLKSLYFQGLAPKSVNLYWRRFAISTIPLSDAKVFDRWLLERWTEKDALLEQFVQTGRFPANNSEVGSAEKKSDYIETEVRSGSMFEFLLTFIPMIILGFFIKVIMDLWAGRH